MKERTAAIYPSITAMRAVPIQRKGWAWGLRIHVPAGDFLLVYRKAWRRTFYVRGRDAEGTWYILGFPTKNMALFAAGIMLGGKCDLDTVFPDCRVIA